MSSSDNRKCLILFLILLIQTLKAQNCDPYWIIKAISKFYVVVLQIMSKIIWFLRVSDDFLELRLLSVCKRLSLNFLKLPL